MALFRSLVRAPTKVNPFTPDRKILRIFEFYLMFVSFVFQGVFSAISRNAFSTTPRASATVSAQRIKARVKGSTLFNPKLIDGSA